VNVKFAVCDCPVEAVAATVTANGVLVGVPPCGVLTFDDELQPRQSASTAKPSNPSTGFSRGCFRESASNSTQENITAHSEMIQSRTPPLGWKSGNTELGAVVATLTDTIPLPVTEGALKLHVLRLPAGVMVQEEDEKLIVPL